VALASSSRVSGASRSSNASSAAGKVIPQRVPQPLGVPGTFPDQRLVRAGHHLDRRGQRVVSSYRPQLVRIGAHHVRQDMSVTGVAFRAGHAVAFPVPVRLQRVDREHRVPGGDQRGHKPDSPPHLMANYGASRELIAVVSVSYMIEWLTRASRSRGTYDGAPT
jgi:hypothetical protein